MCGLVGIFYKSAGDSPEWRMGPAGDVLVRMCQDLWRRGPDSTGFAVYGPRSSGALVVRVDLDRPDLDQPDLDRAGELVAVAAEQLVPVNSWRRTGRSLRLEVGSDGDGKLADWI
ncbi:MAG: hypothetical protein ACRD0O_22275, partial [Acidimicrobiia bacterium]